MFTHEFNDSGQWRPALIIRNKDESGGTVDLTFYVEEDSTWQTRPSVSVGDGPGTFRAVAA